LYRNLTCESKKQNKITTQSIAIDASMSNSKINEDSGQVVNRINAVKIAEICIARVKSTDLLLVGKSDRKQCTFKDYCCVKRKEVPLFLYILSCQSRAIHFLNALGFSFRL
jgi:hypothetical protein